jgi:hypothetical protein
MAQFLTGKLLTDTIYDIIWNAESDLLIVSPFIRLDDYFKTLFLNHKHNHKLHMLIIFGKNEGMPSKSLQEADFDFFKQFRNISIVYSSSLHAKYYANEKEGVLTSINLYDSSFQRNIEFGTHYTGSILDNFKDSVDTKAWNYSQELASQHPAIFIKRPVYEKRVLSGLFGKNYVDSEILLNQTDSFLKRPQIWKNEEKRYINDFPDELDSTNRGSARPLKDDYNQAKKDYSYQVAENKNTNYQNGNYNNNYYQKIDPVVGFCIRTGVPISYNPQQPFCNEAYTIWAQFKNPDYPEKYCHLTGKSSNGKTSKRNPILLK